MARPSPTAIRSATEHDLAALMPLLRAYCRFYGTAPDDAGLERMVRELTSSPEEEGFLLVAADESDEVIGFAACGWKWSSLRAARIVVLEDLFVGEQARGRGYADALIKATADVAGRHGSPVVTWLTKEDNHRARAVYDRVGGHSEPFVEYELELSGPRTDSA